MQFVADAVGADMEEAGSVLAIKVTESVEMENVESIVPKLQTIAGLGVPTSPTDSGRDVVAHMRSGAGRAAGGEGRQDCHPVCCLRQEAFEPRTGLARWKGFHRRNPALIRGSVPNKAVRIALMSPAPSD